MRERLDFGRGPADDADQENLAAALAREPRRLQCEAPAAAENRQRLCDPTQAISSLPSRGVQIARSPPSRRNATICCTASSSGNAAATSSARSVNVPVGANNIL